MQLVADAFRRAAQAYVVVSNDSNVTQPLQLVRHDLGYPVGLVNPHRQPSQALMRCRPSFTLRVSATALGAAQFPDLIPRNAAAETEQLVGQKRRGPPWWASHPADEATGGVR